MNKKKYQYLTTLKEIIHKYEIYLIDLAGVIYDGHKPFPYAIDTINDLILDKKQVIFLSNNPRPSTLLYQKLTSFGIKFPYRMITSGDILHHTLATILSEKNIYHLGRNHQHEILFGTNANLVPSPFDADAVIVSCFVEGDENHAMFNRDLQQIIESEKIVYCPNPDQLALEGSILRYPSGYFAHKLQKKGVNIIYLGKPSPIIYNFMVDTYQDISFIRNKILMIGDTLETDILGAINFGIDSLLVLSGITYMQSLKNSSLIDQSPYYPTYIMKELR